MISLVPPRKSDTEGGEWALDRQIWVPMQALHLLVKVVDLREPQFLMYKIRTIILIVYSYLEY